MKLDKPILQQLQAYWEVKRGDRPYPGREDIDPLELRFIIGHLILVDIELSPLRFRYRLFGTAIVQRQGFDMTGKYLDQHPWPELAAMAQQTYLEVIDSGKPALIRRRGLVNDGYVDHQSLILPLGHSRVEMLLSGVVFTPEAEQD
ncbi:PAS domain-containing protein [Ferrovibrio terrae]|uniref:PAS domain-containing protein n=1 Tax=Ferrovibrio terrae TaxID=2594003 RepID=A0A516H598_9PROT|nr:PAS domain-containing protein [Ferrovibrio terrae]QDO98922.1 PAS domain-containing protein [Ferrovibrio terrae]